MTLYVKGFKIDRQKIANIIGASDKSAPLVENGINLVVDRLNRDGYLNISGGWEPPGPDGERHLSIIIALAFGRDEEELKKKDLVETDESILEALPHVLVGPDVWEVVR